MMEVAEIARRLAQRTESLVRELMPAGRREGAEWRDADAPAGRGSTLYVHLSGARAGVWSHFSAAENGDALDLVAYIKFGGDKKQAIPWAKAWLGLWDDRRATTARQAPSPPPEAVPDAEEIARAEKKRRWACALFLRGAQSLKGTPADWYLKARGLDLAKLERQPGSLRFAPACEYPTSIYPAGGNYPAMLAAITSLEGEFVAVHRTYLEVHAIGRAAKLSTVPKAKLVAGRYAGGLVRIWHGAMTNEETGEIREAPKLGELAARQEALQAKGWNGAALQEMHLTEGIENALTVAVACPDYRVAAAVSIANLARVRLPEAITRVVLWKDNDGDNSAARRGFEKALYWFKGHGKRVEVVELPDGVKDINDYWRSVA